MGQLAKACTLAKARWILGGRIAEVKKKNGEEYKPAHSFFLNVVTTNNNNNNNWGCHVCPMSRECA